MSPQFESAPFKLMLACLTDPEAAARLADARIDWPAFVALLRRQQVLSLIVHQIQDTPLQTQLPKPVWRQLRVLAALNAEKAQALADETMAIEAALNAADIPRLHYKGAVWANRFYNDVARREFGDIDFLFPRHRMDNLVHALKAMGYSHQQLAAEPYLQQFDKDLLLRREGYIVEAHWSITASRISIQVDYEAVWNQAEAVSFGTGTVRSFSLEHALIIMCIGGAKAQWQRLQMFTDVTQLVRTADHLDWQRVMTDAETWGCAVMVKTGLRFCADYLNLELPAEVQHWVASHQGYAGHLRWIQRALTTDPDDIWYPAGAAAYHPFMRQMHQGWWNQCTYTLRAITSPSISHARRFRLPRLLQWLYPLIVPVYDYCFMPLIKRRRAKASG